MMYTGETENIVYSKWGIIIIKNPKSLVNIDSYSRGVIDKYGNLYIEKKELIIHDKISSIECRTIMSKGVECS